MHLSAAMHVCTERTGLMAMYMYVRAVHLQCINLLVQVCLQLGKFTTGAMYQLHVPVFGPSYGNVVVAVRALQYM